jgi:hypothetical protein
MFYYLAPHALPSPAFRRKSLYPFLPVPDIPVEEEPIEEDLPFWPLERLPVSQEPLGEGEEG